MDSNASIRRRPKQREHIVAAIRGQKYQILPFTAEERAHNRVLVKFEFRLALPWGNPVSGDADDGKPSTAGSAFRIKKRKKKGSAPLVPDKGIPRRPDINIMNRRDVPVRTRNRSPKNPRLHRRWVFRQSRNVPCRVQSWNDTAQRRIRAQ